MQDFNLFFRGEPDNKLQVQGEWVKYRKRPEFKGFVCRNHCRNNEWQVIEYWSGCTVARGTAKPTVIRKGRECLTRMKESKAQGGRGLQSNVLIVVAEYGIRNGEYQNFARWMYDTIREEVKSELSN